MARRSRRKKLPKEPVQARIKAFTHDGRGIAYVDDKAVFIDGSIPGELVSFVYTNIRRDFAEGRVDRVLTASDERVEPQCPHYDICGGCSLQHLDPHKQILTKQDLLVEQLENVGKLEVPALWPPLTGAQWGYRHKARLGVKYVAKKARVLVGFREKRNRLIADIEHCPVLHPHVGNRLMELSCLIASLTIKDRIPQIEVAIGDRHSALVFRILQDITRTDRERLGEFGDRHGFDIYLQRQGPESVVPLDAKSPSMLSYSLPNHAVSIDFSPIQFTQVNAEMNRKMVDRVIEVLQPATNDTILDLFCGLGNFTLPLARKAAHVVGVEGSSELVRAARHNAGKNGIDNVSFHAADLTQDPSGQAWAGRRYRKVLLDPSRAGAREVLAFLPRWGAERIVYVSCNPSTLARDAGILVHELGYKMSRAGVMDMFPHTAHVESIALFEKR